ncbi:carbohydrate ABC transporter permease [Isoptericola sp. 4D.3]|jgi:alpha-glucoside transport system permease protein|uniref:Carbohydrate ABC transporter permease n=1 Tax=Isoptericola peretonis TaxID=2918523 RepID=A0ABT0J6H3_9MICO|nr:carbohydrate ABC transporter permease [Isoptericola sp. 4D.3]
MSTTPTPPVTDADAAATPAPRSRGVSDRARIARKRLSNPWASGIALVLAVLWTIPTLGLLVTSFRPELEIRRSGWWTIFGDVFSGEAQFSLDNYETALFGSSTNLGSYFLNSIVITLPAVIIPITLALLAAYAFAWIEFPGRDFLFVAVFALQIIPIQITMIPLLSAYVSAGVAGTFWTVWLSHSIFALPLAIFLLHNFMKDIPASLVEAARVDGAGHVKIFFRVMLPLLVPAIAAFGIFQFLWVWNDLLVALVFTGATPDVAPLTVRVAELAGSRGGDWPVLSAGAFISMVVPLVVFLGLQRYFVRGLLAGSVKG